MSHAATNWAFSQKGLKASTKMVLLALADCHNPSHGCYPSQEFLSSVCNLSRSTINVHLAELEKMGLISREKRRDKGSKKQLPTRYFLAFDEGMFALDSVSENQTWDAEAVSGKQTNPCPEIDESRVRKSDSNPVIGTVIEPVNKKQTKKNGDLRFEEFWDAFQDKRGKQGALRVWKRKNLDAIADQVISGAKTYVQSRGADGRYWKQAQGWLNDERWDDEIPPVGQGIATGNSQFSKQTTPSTGQMFLEMARLAEERGQ